MRVTPAAVVAVALVVAGCGAREDDAASLSTEVATRISSGSCDDGPSWLGAADWTTLCGAVRAQLPPGGSLAVASTTAEQSGEIGYRYTSVARFTDAENVSRTLTLSYAGGGWSGAKPELSYVTLDDVTIFEAKPRGS